uniref:Uncharacterized protein n=1 Tax=Macaca fascicularis TaxID=9541 RepID=A0A7N9DBG2_MACFA
GSRVSAAPCPSLPCRRRPPPHRGPKPRATYPGGPAPRGTRREPQQRPEGSSPAPGPPPRSRGRRPGAAPAGTGRSCRPLRASPPGLALPRAEPSHVRPAPASRLRPQPSEDHLRGDLGRDGDHRRRDLLGDGAGPDTAARFSLNLTPEAVLVIQRRHLEKQLLARPRRPFPSPSAEPRRLLTPCPRARAAGLRRAAPPATLTRPQQLAWAAATLRPAPSCCPAACRFPS